MASKPKPQDVQQDDKARRPPPLQITCTKEFPDLKADVEDLAKSFGQNTADFLRDVVVRVVELNRARIEKYRELKKLPLVVEKPKKKSCGKKSKSAKTAETDSPTDNAPMDAPTVEGGA